jgi:hypothetical protein
MMVDIRLWIVKGASFFARISYRRLPFTLSDNKLKVTKATASMTPISIHITLLSVLISCFTAESVGKGWRPIFFGPCTPHGTPGQARRTWGTRPGKGFGDCAEPSFREQYLVLSLNNQRAQPIEYGGMLVR